MARSSSEKLNGMVISDTSIRQPVFITMLMVLAIVVGLLAYTTLPVNLLPDISVPVVAVTMAYPGAGPESVADQVAKPVEDTLNTLNGVKHITSNSSEGLTVIIVEFDTSVNVDKAEQGVRDKVNAVRPTLPTDVRDPVFLKFDPNDSPILTVAVAGDGTRSPLELRKLVDNDIVPRLQRVEGVGSVSVNGGQVRQINVQMDLNKLKAYQILPVQITRALQQANSNFGLGTITAGEQDVGLRAPSMLEKPEDIARVQITGTPYNVGDVATVEDGVADSVSYARLDGKDAITIAVRKQSGTNTVAVADAVKAEVAKLFEGRPELRYFVPNDQSTAVKNSTRSAIEELLIASLAAMLIVWLFFRDLRNTLVTVAGLPVIMIGTFAAIKLFGLTINLLTLLALSLSVGLVIDDAIVVRENIFRQMERGATPRQASSRGTAQVALSVLAMSLTIIAVFLPVTFTSGVTGIIFKSFGITVACAMAISLIEAFTLAPMLSAFFFKQKNIHGHTHSKELTPEQELLEEAKEDPGRIGQFYGRLLAWSLNHRLAVVVIALVVFVASFGVASTLKFSFFPAQDTHTFNVGYELQPGTPLARTDELAKQVEALLSGDQDVEAVLANVGGTGASERAEFFVKLHENASTPVVQQRLREQLTKLNLPNLAFSPPSFQGNSTAITSRTIQVSIQTTKPVSELVPLLQQLQGQANGIQGLVDVEASYKPGKPELRFHVDPSKSGDLGVTNDDIAQSVRTLINGSRATVLRQNGDDTDIYVRLRAADRSSVEAIRGISVPTRAGSVPLSSLVRLEVASSPTTIRRYDRLNQVLIGANVEGRNANEVQAEIASRLKGQGLPSDVTVSFVGQTQQQTEGFNTLIIAMLLSVLFVYMVLASQFGSFLQPLVIMLAMPFSFIGAFLALRLTNIDLDITGMIGLIMLLGLVTKNSILLVDFANRLRDAGMEKHAALEAAGAIRLRPILMTTLALVVGSLPVAIGIGEGTEFRRGLSIVLIGGLITSMLLTLLVVPTAYSILDSVLRRVGRLFRRGGTPQPFGETAPLQPAASTTNGSELLSVKVESSESK